MKVTAIFLVFLLGASFVPAFALYSQPLPPGQAAISSTTIQPLNSTTIPQKTTYDPSKVNGLRQDLGKFSFDTSLTAIQWNTTNQDYLQFNPPSIGPTVLQNSLIYYNSTETAWQMSSGLNTVSVFVKPGTYSANVFIQANLASAQQMCFPFVAPVPITQQQGFNFTTGKATGLLPSVNAGNEGFSWSDILANYSPTWNAQTNALCMNLPIGQTIIDPIALDGSARNHSTSGTTLTCTLTTASSPDVIILDARFDEATDSNLASVSDTSSLSWTSHVNVASNPAQQYIAEWYAVASGTLTGDVITATSPNAGVFNDVTCFGVSGANTSAGTIFDTNAQAHSTCTGAAASCTGPAGGAILASIATNNANDMAIGWAMGFSAASPSAGAPWTSIQCANGNFNCAEYDVLSATTASLSLAFGGASMQFSLADAICQSGSSCSAATTVTQGIQIFLGETGPAYPTISISGCAVSNATFTTPNVHTYTLTASCSVTLSNPAATTYTRYKFNISPKPESSTSITFTTCASGTCSLYQNTTYYQLLNNFTEIAQSPTKWDGFYENINANPGTAPPGFNDFTGTYLGTVLTASSSNDLCFVVGSQVAETFQGSSYGHCENGGAFNSFMWADYGTGCWPKTIGNTWSLQTACPNPTTGNNVYLGNYTQNRPFSLLILGGIVVGFMLVGLMVAYRRRY